MENTAFLVQYLQRFTNPGKSYLFVWHAAPLSCFCTVVPLLTPHLLHPASPLHLILTHTQSGGQALFLQLSRAASIRVCIHSWVVLNKEQRESALHPSLATNQNLYGHPSSWKSLSHYHPGEFHAGSSLPHCSGFHLLRLPLWGMQGWD